MRSRRALRVAAGTSLGLAALASCDLFHSTTWPDACDVDATATGCIDAVAPPLDFCAWDHATVQAKATAACAWLAACETPVGANQTGTCLAEAILALDCAANPGRRPQGDAKTFWECLLAAADARSCGAVKQCVFAPTRAEGGVPQCSADAAPPFVACSTVAPAARAVCTKAGDFPSGEPCVAQGRTCATRAAGSTEGECTGAAKRACTTSGCVGSSLQLCDDAGVDRGMDCRYVGAGSCVGGATPSCKPLGDAACVPTADIACSEAGVATGCATGIQERVDCTVLTGPGGCTPIVDGGVGLPPSAACTLASGCSEDTCSGATLNACVRGRAVAVSCGSLGLGACVDVPTFTPEGTRAACGRP
jgi:hypothetical protein